MDRSKSPQHDEESLFLFGLESVLCDALREQSEAAGGKRIGITTYAVQDLHTQLGAVALQFQDKGPAFLIQHDLNQGSNGFAFV